MSQFLVDPNTGQKWEFPDDQVDAAREHLGWSTPEAYAEQQKTDQLQAEHGTLGEELKTGGEQALTAAAAPLGAIAAPEDVDAMGNPTALSPIPVSPEAAARAEANPKAAFAGKLLGSLPEYAELGAATGGLGAGLGAAPLATAALTNTVLGTTQEVAASNEENNRPIDIGNIGKNIAFGAILEGGGYGIAKGLGAAFGEAAPSAVKQAVQRTIDRAGAAGEDLGHPDVLASARADTQAKIEQTATELADAASSVKPVVANNVVAQRSALRSLADAHPELADDLEAAVKRPRDQRFQAILDLRDAAETPQAAEALDTLATDRSLWGDAAVEHANTMQALDAAYAQGPEALAEAARNIKDPTVQELVAKLDSHFDDQSAYTAIEAFGDQSTVGAAQSNFSDTTWDKARSEVLNDEKSAVALASEAPALYYDAANVGARAAQHLDDAIKNEFSMGAKYADWDAAAQKWTPTKVKNQSRWIQKQLGAADETQLAIGALKDQGFDGGSYAARARKTIDEYATRIRGAAEPLEAAKMVEGLKRSLDGQIARLSSASNAVLEEPVRQELINSLRPLADSLRSGLEDTSLWGAKMARYQAASNAAWHEGIPALGRVFRDLGDREGVVWSETGQKAQIWRADPDKVVRRLAAPLQGGINFQEDLAQASKTIEDLIAAKEAHGIKPVNLQQARAALQSLRESNEMASVLAVADRKAAQAAGAGGHGGMNPGSAIGGIAGHFAEYGLRASTGIGLGSLPRLEGQKVGGALWRRAAAFLGKDVTPRFGEEGSAVREAVTGFARRARATVGDLHANNAIATQVHGFAPAYTQLLRDQGGEVNLGEGVLKRGASNNQGPEPGASARPPLRPPVSTSAVGESVPANEAESAAAVARSPEYEAARAKIEAARGRAKQAGMVDLGRQSLEDLKALPIEGDSDRARVDALKADKNFQETGRVTSNDGRQGITLVDDDGQLVLRDGRHRLVAAQELGRDSVYGRLVDGKTGREVFSGEIPLKGSQRGFADMASGLATSPLGMTVGAGALGLGAHKAYQLAQDYPDDQHARYLASAGARDTASTARALTDPSAASEFARRSAGAPSTLELFQGDHATLQQAFTEQRGLIERALRDPSGVIDKLAEAFGGLSPGLRDGLGAKAMQLATYLHGQLPPQRGVSVARPNGLPPSPLEARSYALKHMTALEPSTAFDDAKRGTLRHEQVDTLKAVWPELYDELRAQTFEAMTAGKSTIQQRQRADLLFGFSSALDPAFSIRLSAAAAAARQSQPQAQGAPSGAPAKSRVTQDLQPAGLAALSA